jgi:hypothetical protein
MILSGLAESVFLGGLSLTLWTGQAKKYGVARLWAAVAGSGVLLGSVVNPKLTILVLIVTGVVMALMMICGGNPYNQNSQTYGPGVDKPGSEK